jgi:photosystem II stability/assembly factor-like uncharacterized protein
MNVRRIAFLALLLMAVAGAAAQEVKINVGPNYLVSRDGDVAHAETMIAANPQDPKNLIAASITATRPDGGWACRTYASRDGGATWRYSDFPEQVEFGGADPQIVFTPDGTAIFIGLTADSVRDDTGRKRGGMQIYRSTDGGFTWARTQNICCSHDHPQTTVDLSNGKYSGRVYVGTLHDYPVYRVSIFRSDNGGQTFVGPVEAANGGGTIGINVVSTTVMSDGTLVVPYVDFEFLPEKRQTKGLVSSNLWQVSSADGGLTFSKPVKVVTFSTDIEKREAFSVPTVAASSVSRQFPDHLYVAYGDAKTGKSRIYFIRSTDKGKTWSAPVALASNVPEHTLQFQPTAAVNKDGVFGLYWYDTRHSPDGSEFHVYFAATTDGGKTFLEPARVTTEPSRMRGAGNLRPMGMTYKMGDSGTISLLSAANRWANGGDYLGLTSTRTGVFYPLWTDARTGTYQLYTSPITVTLPPTAEEKARKAALEPYYGKEAAGSDPAKRVETSILDDVEFVFDPTTVREGNPELWVRLKNKSEKTIYGPVRMQFTGFGFPPNDEGKEFAPEILNAPNGKTGVGAEFVFDLGHEGVLRPGMLSGAIPIRVREVDPTRTPPMRYSIHGFTDPK